MLTFKDYPNTDTPINSANLNNNFEELKKDYIFLKLPATTDVNSNDAIPYEVAINTNSSKFIWNEETHCLRAPAGKYRISGNVGLTGSSSGAFALSLIANGKYNAVAYFKKEANELISASISPYILDYNGTSDLFMRIAGEDITLGQGEYSPMNWCLIEEI